MLEDGCTTLFCFGRCTVGMSPTSIDKDLRFNLLVYSHASCLRSNSFPDPKVNMNLSVGSLLFTSITIGLIPTDADQMAECFKLFSFACLLSARFRIDLFAAA